MLRVQNHVANFAVVYPIGKDWSLASKIIPLCPEVAEFIK